MPKSINVRLMELEDAYTYEDRIDVDEWDALADLFERANRPARAEQIRTRARIRAGLVVDSLSVPVALEVAA